MSGRTHKSVSYALSFAQLALAVGFFLACGCGMANAQDAHVVHIPITFHGEARDIATKACLEVKEQRYPAQGAWWEDTAGAATASDRAFGEVISAIQHKNHAALLRLSDAKETKDMKRFDEQAGAFFQQFGALEIIAVPQAYDFDGLSVFFVKLRTASNKLFFAPFVFALQDDGSYKFLPSRTRKVTYELVNDWFEAPWGPSASEKPVYCSGEDIKRATHSVELAPPEGSMKAFPSRLYLTGASFTAPGDLSGLVTRLKTEIGQMSSLLAAGKINEFIADMTPEGGNRLKQWFAGADQADRDRYKSAFTRQKPFFVFDESPLMVVYTLTADGTVQVMYFTSADNELLWTNSSHVTVADQVFKKGPLYKAGLLKKPFSSIAIK